MSVSLYLGRHGETALNSEDRLRGWIDEPLNAAGIKEAEAMAQKMKKYPIDRFYCSDLDRADHTARIVAKEHGLKPIPRKWFRPIDFGDLNGKPVKDIQEQLDQLTEMWKTDPNHEAPGGESFTEFQERNLGGLNAVLHAATENESLMIVAHLRNCLLFWSVAKNGGPLQGESLDLLNQYHQESGDVSKFQWDGQLTFAGKL